MFNEPIDFKEQMAEARRTQILMGAAKVFAEKGYHRATTKEIAQTAGVSEGTIYNYFENKRELLLAMIEMLAIDSLKNIISLQAPTDPKEFITAVLHNRYQLAVERGPLIMPLLAEMFTDAELRQEVYRKLAMPVAAMIERYIQAEVDAGRFRPVNPVIVTRIFIGAIIVNFAMKLAHLDPRYEAISEETLINDLADLFLSMLFNPERIGEEEVGSKK